MMKMTDCLSGQDMYGDIHGVLNVYIYSTALAICCLCLGDFLHQLVNVDVAKARAVLAGVTLDQLLMQ